MKKIIIGAAVISSFLGGCRVIQPEYQPNKDSTAMMVLGSKFAKSFADYNADEFLECLSPEVRESLNKEKFENSYREIVDKFGNVESCELMGNLENPIYQIQLWKMRFAKGNNINDMLFRVLMAETDGHIQVVSFAFL